MIKVTNYTIVFNTAVLFSFRHSIRLEGQLAEYVCILTLMFLNLYVSKKIWGVVSFDFRTGAQPRPAFATA